jgi:hypothetical protein
VRLCPFFTHRQTDDTEANTIVRPLNLFITIVIIKEGRTKNQSHNDDTTHVSVLKAGKFSWNTKLIKKGKESYAPLLHEKDVEMTTGNIVNFNFYFFTLDSTWSKRKFNKNFIIRF